MKRRLIWLTVLVVLFAPPALTIAQDYPTKAITLISPWPAGGGIDLLARAFASVAEKYIDKPIVVVNKTGSFGTVGTLAGAQAKPDGYTLCMGLSQQNYIIILDRLAGRKPSFSMEDFVILGRLTESPNIFLVPYNSPWKTIQQALADIKAHPDTYSCSSGGRYGVSHLPLELLASELGLKFRSVPYDGGGPALMAVVGEHVHFAAQFPGTSLPKIRAKQLRGLAQFGEKRVKNYEDIPTFKELGYNVVYAPWFGMLAPKGTPPPIVEKLRTLVKQVTSDTAFIDIVEKIGDQVNYADAETLKKIIQKEYDEIHKLIERLEKEKK